MSEAPQRVIKRQVVMADGRYLIFYEFLPCDGAASLEPPAVQISATTADKREGKELASIVKMVLVAFDKLFKVSFPYMMVMHQRPVDDLSYDYYHFHIEFYPPLRSANRLKYLAGSETGAGMVINDTLPEEKANELCALVSEVVWQAPNANKNG